MLNEENRKRILIILGALFFVSLLLFIIFINRSNDKNIKKKDDNNYSIVYYHYTNKTKDQKMEFVYRKKQLKDIILTLYFDKKSDAEFIADELKSSDDYKSVTSKGTSLVLTYKDEDIKEYQYLTKKELKEIMDSKGYKTK